MLALEGHEGRYETDDQLWFTLFQQLGHTLLHSRSDAWVDNSALADSPKEAEANTFACGQLIPETYLSRLRALKSLDSVRAFAKELSISPGIVVGRLQHEGLWPPRQGNSLKQKINLEGDL